MKPVMEIDGIFHFMDDKLYMCPLGFGLTFQMDKIISMSNLEFFPSGKCFTSRKAYKVLFLELTDEETKELMGKSRENRYTPDTKPRSIKEGTIIQ